MHLIVLEESELRWLSRLLDRLTGAGASVPCELPDPQVAHHAETQRLIQQVQRTLNKMADDTDLAIKSLTDDVANLTSVVGSATTAFSGLQKQLAEAIAAAGAKGATPEQLASLHELDGSLQSNIAALSAAIPANTPADGGSSGGSGATGTAGGVPAGSPDPAAGAPPAGGLTNTTNTAGDQAT